MSTRRIASGLPAFLLLVALVSLCFAPRLWAIRTLYLDASARAAAASALPAAADREGWLVSDLEVIAADASSLTVLHRRHLRGPDPVTCHVLRLSDAALLPCDAG